MTACGWIYGALLLLYPEELRRDFGAEIREVFDDDLNEAWRSRGFRGVLGVWWCALCEVAKIAVPAMKANPAFAVPAIALGLNGLVIGIQVAVYLVYIATPGRAGGVFAWGAGAILCGTSIAVAIVAVAVVRASQVRMVSLKLNDGH